jgi:Ca2+/H+ antiporter, TMEM165/GDT1 family
MTHLGWTHAGASAAAAFLASLVEFIEVLTVVLAVGAGRGWRGALSGAALALLVLLALTTALGPALMRIPIDVVQLGVGSLLFLFGLRCCVRRSFGRPASSPCMMRSLNMRKRLPS